VLLGGEHTLTAGAVAACAARYPDLAVLYLDAHADVRGPYLGATYNHASALRLALDALDAVGARGARGPAARGSVRRAASGASAPPAVAIGIRSLAAEEASYIARTGLRVVAAERVAAARLNGAAALDALWSESLQRLGPAGRPLYVSVDLDAFDPSLMAAVGTPEPGGLEWYEVLALLRAAARRYRVVMADVMELAPAEGPLACTYAAAKLTYKLIGYALRLGEGW
jgi:agmatinase